ncbi:MAG TPA: response regulator [Thiotrichaceae bacterium]|nr:response regulator [Thiotrichaceae bacterium]
MNKLENINFKKSYAECGLKAQGWRFFQAENGKVALEHLEHKKPTLILLDLTIPIMDGFEFIAHLQNDEKWHDTPIVVLTARQLSAEELAQLNQHVETIFNKKALNQEDLVLSIHQLISESASVHHEDLQKQEWE